MTARGRVSTRKHPAAGLLLLAVLVASGSLLALPGPVAAAWEVDLSVDFYSAGGYGDGSGSVTSDDDNISCTWAAGQQTGDCSEHYVLPNFQTTYDVTLTFTPATGSYVCLIGGGSCYPGGAAQTWTITYSLGGATSFLAWPSFNLRTFTVGVNIDGPGSISSNGTACSPVAPADYCRSFKYGSAANLTAVPDPGKVFTYWSGNPCAGFDPACLFTVTGNVSLGATFGRVPVSLDIVGSGDVCTPTGEFLCTVGIQGGVSNYLVVGSTLTLEATPSSGWRFDHWNSGPCSGKPATCSFIVQQTTALVATFKRIATPAPTTKPTAKPTTQPTTAPNATAAPASAPASTAAVSPETSPPPGEGAPSGSIDPASPGTGALPSPAPSTASVPTGSASTTGIDLTVLILLVVIAILILALGFVLGRQRQARGVEDR